MLLLRNGKRLTISKNPSKEENFSIIDDIQTFVRHINDIHYSRQKHTDVLIVR